MSKILTFQSKEYDMPPRIKRLKQLYESQKPTLSMGRAKAVTAVYQETEGDPAILRRAKTVKRYCEEKNIYIQDDELIIGGASEMPRGANFFPEVGNDWLFDEKDTIAVREQDPYVFPEEEKKVFLEEIYPYWKGKTSLDFCKARFPEETWRLGYQTGLLDFEIRIIDVSGETCPDYEGLVLRYGIEGRKKAAEKVLAELDYLDAGSIKKADFYKAEIICCEGIETYIRRNGEAARKKADAERDPMRKKELEQIAEDCFWLEKNAPVTFRQAIQMVIFTQNALYFDSNGSAISLGRIDQYLYPFYEKDLKAGVVTKEEVQELLDCFWLKIADNNWLLNASWAQFSAGYMPYQNVCVGGITKDGWDAVNDLSYMVLQACMDVRTHQPSLSVRLNKKNPPEFSRKICELARLGMGFPGIHNDDVEIKSVLKKGVTAEEARDWTTTGCVEPYVAGKTFQWNEIAQYAFSNPVEFAIHNGRSIVLDGDYGLKTGDFCDFKSFDEFYDAVKKQMEYIIDQAAIADNVLEVIHAEKFPFPTLSLFYHGCMEKGKDVLEGGALYPTGSGVMAIGLGDAVDSLAAVKKLVFDEKKIAPETLRTALEHDFEGYEDIRSMLIHDAPKYGNGNPEVDHFATELVNYHIKKLEEHQTYRGGHMFGATYSASANVPQGLAVGALPSGRKSTTALSDGISPCRGADVKGITTVLHSVSAINQEDIDGGTLLNIKLDPSVVAGEEGLMRFMALLDAFLDSNDAQIQFNVVSTEVLLEAQEKPEDFDWLIVRVAGYSAKFVHLNRDSQNDIINRTLNKAIS